MSAYERVKRSRMLAKVRENAAAGGVNLRSGGPRWQAMVGTKDDGSVWVWNELTGSLAEVCGPGTVDVRRLPPSPGKNPAPVTVPYERLGFEALLD